MDANTMYMFFGMYMLVTLMGAIILFCFSDVILALKRKFIPKGCDVYIINPSRQMTHIYQVPKDGTFKIQNKTYIVNPNKIINLDEKTIDKVNKSLKERKAKIENLIAEFTIKCKEYEKQLADLKIKGDNNGVPELFAAKETLEQRIRGLKEDLDSGEEYFYHKKRATFFFIEGDPVPKNLFDNYSEVDCDIIDNLIASCLTKDPKSIQEWQKMVKSIKLWLYIAAGAGAIACLILINMQQKGIKCIGAV